MNHSTSSIKQKLDEAISQVCETFTVFSKKPGVYFTKDRKLPIKKVISCLLSIRQTKEIKKLCENRNQYRFVYSGNAFDYLPRKNRKHDPIVFYRLPFRIVRFKITDDTYETVVTNLNKHIFPAAELKKIRISQTLWTRS